MTDRYAIYSDFQQLTERYGLVGEEEFMIPNYNCSPSQLLPVLLHSEREKLSFLNWGIHKELANNKSVSPKLLSVSLEALSKKNVLKNALMKSRCMIPANGFYAWKQYSKKRKVPHYFKHPDNEIFSLVGIWEQFENMDGSVVRTFKFLERENYSNVPEFGSHMPVIISKEDEDKFMDDYTELDDLLELMKKEDLSSGLSNHSVSSMIINPKCNRKELIDPHAQVDQLGNYTLFE